MRRRFLFARCCARFFGKKDADQLGKSRQSGDFLFCPQAIAGALVKPYESGEFPPLQRIIHCIIE